MEASINYVFMAGIIGLFIANIQSPEIRSAKVYFGAGKIKKPPNLAHVEAYVSIVSNIGPLRNYFYWRNILKVLFYSYCISASLYLILLAMTLVEIDPISPATPNEYVEKVATLKIITTDVTDESNIGSATFDIESFVIVAKSPESDIKTYPLAVPENDGQLVWLAGNGTLTKVNIGTALQFFGFLSVFLGIATFAMIHVIRESSD